jgi:hypothetical protein
MLRSLSLTAVLAASLALPAVASADDAGLYRAYKSHARELNRAGAEYLSAVRRLRRSHHYVPRVAKAIIRADRKMDAALGKRIRALGDETASSQAGTSAKRLALGGFRDWRTANVFEIRYMRAYVHKNGRAMKRWWRRSNEANDRAARRLKRADALFKKAGFG